MSQTTEATLLVAAMVVTFGAAVRFGRLTDSLAILAAAVAGIGLAGFGWHDSLRHVVDGSFTFLPIVLIIFAAQLFIDVQKDSGALDAAVRHLVARFHAYPRLLLVLLMFLNMVNAMIFIPSLVAVFKPKFVAEHKLG